MRMIITPKFNAKEIYDSTISKDWFIFQNSAYLLGQRTALYMQNYINRNRHRRGGTGKLAKAMQFKGFTAPGIVSWGIGFMPSLPKYWYVINYGKMVTGEAFIPFRGRFVPGSFEGNRPSSALKGGVEHFNIGDGSGFGMKAKSVIRPINYIQATYIKLNANLTALLARIRMAR